jgi:hypothetical protein
MERLCDCPIMGPEGERRRGPYKGWVTEPKGKQRLSITSDEVPFLVYSLDPQDLVGRKRVDWPEGQKRPEAVLIASRAEGSLVCFLELKASLKTDPEKHRRAMAQIEGGVQHFAPTGRMGGVRSHGDDHHDRWSSGDDLPATAPDNRHRVAGIVVAFRQLPRMPPEPPRTVCGKEIVISVVQVSLEKYNQASITLEGLLRKARI